jgi:hypothetical protein
VRDALRGDRREQDRVREILSEKLEPRVDAMDVVQDARAQPNPVVCLTIPFQGELIRRAAVDVLPRRRGNAILRRTLVVGEGDERRYINRLSESVTKNP